MRSTADTKRSDAPSARHPPGMTRPWSGLRKEARRRGVRGQVGTGEVGANEREQPAARLLG